MTETIELDKTTPNYSPEVEEWLRAFLGASEAYFVQWVMETQDLIDLRKP